MAHREPEVKEYLKQHGDLISRLASRERRYQQLVASAKRLKQLRAACVKLEERVKDLPTFENRLQKLKERSTEHEAEARDVQASEDRLTAREKYLDTREDSLLGTGHRLDIREGVVELEEVNRELRLAKEELDDVKKLLGEKKGLLSRMLGRDQGGNS